MELQSLGHITLLVITGLLLGIMSLPLRPDMSLSRFELARQRRIVRASGHGMAVPHQESWNTALPVLRVLRVLLVAVFCVAALPLLHGATAGNWWVMALVLLLAVLLFLLLRKRRLYQRFGSGLQKRLAPRLLRLEERLRPWLKHAALTTGVTKPPRRVHSLEELLHIAESSPDIDQQDVVLLRAVSAFRLTTAADIMLAAAEAETVGADETIGPVVLTRLHRSSQGWFPVVDADGSVIGGLRLSDVSDVSDKTRFVTARDAVGAYRTAVISPDTNLSEILQRSEDLFIVEDSTNTAVGIVPAEFVSRRLASLE